MSLTDIISSTSSEEQQYDPDACYCPHPQSHMQKHLYATDSALRALILEKNIEYFQNYLKDGGIYRYPGTYIKEILNILSKSYQAYISKLISYKSIIYLSTEENWSS